MRAGDLWKRLVRRYDIAVDYSPDEYEVFNGTVIFWFYEGGKLHKVLKKLKEVGVDYNVQWDREEGAVGLALKRDILH